MNGNTPSSSIRLPQHKIKWLKPLKKKRENFEFEPITLSPNCLDSLSLLLQAKTKRDRNVICNISDLQDGGDLHE